MKNKKVVIILIVIFILIVIGIGIYIYNQVMFKVTKNNCSINMEQEYKMINNEENENCINGVCNPYFRNKSNINVVNK